MPHPSNATTLASVIRETGLPPASLRKLIKEAGLKVVGIYVVEDPKGDGMGWDRLAELSGNFEIRKNPAAAKWQRSDHGAMLVTPTWAFHVQRRIRRGFGLQEHGTKTYYVLVRTPTGGAVGGYHTQPVGGDYASVADAKAAAENWIATGKIMNPKKNPVKPHAFKLGDVVRQTGAFLRSIGSYSGNPVNGVVCAFAKGLNFPVILWSDGKLFLVHPNNLEIHKAGQEKMTSGMRAAYIKEGAAKYQASLDAQAAEDAAYWASPAGQAEKAKGGLRAKLNPADKLPIASLKGWAGYTVFGKRIYRCPTNGGVSVQEKPSGWILFVGGDHFGPYKSAGAAIKRFEDGLFVPGSGGAVGNPKKLQYEVVINGKTYRAANQKGVVALLNKFAKFHRTSPDPKRSSDVDILIEHANGSRRHPSWYDGGWYELPGIDPKKVFVGPKRNPAPKFRAEVDTRRPGASASVGYSEPCDSYEEAEAAVQREVARKTARGFTILRAEIVEGSKKNPRFYPDAKGKFKVGEAHFDAKWPDARLKKEIAFARAMGDADALQPMLAEHARRAEADKVLLHHVQSRKNPSRPPPADAVFFATTKGDGHQIIVTPMRVAGTLFYDYGAYQGGEKWMSGLNDLAGITENLRLELPNQKYVVKINKLGQKVNPRIEYARAHRRTRDEDHHPRCATHIDVMSRCSCERERDWDAHMAKLRRAQGPPQGGLLPSTMRRPR